jgi:molybdopterin-guanine dinucleotide biosynthesis protein B
VVLTLKTTVINVVGGKRSGKTTTIEALTKELTRRGYTVAVVKHISEPDFTIDTRGKDTWKFARAGARKIISIANNEIATIEKTNTQNITLREILEYSKTADITFLEGIKKLTISNDKIPKIIAAKTAKEADEFSKNFKPVIAIARIYPAKETNPDIPCIDILKHPERLADIIEKIVKQNTSVG